MAEIKTTPEATEPQETEKTNRFKTFLAQHPRATRVAGFTAAALAVVGAAVAIKSKNDVDADLLMLDSQQDPSYLGPETTTVAEA